MVCCSKKRSSKLNWVTKRDWANVLGKWNANSEWIGVPSEWSKNEQGTAAWSLKISDLVGNWSFKSRAKSGFNSGITTLKFREYKQGEVKFKNIENFESPNCNLKIPKTEVQDYSIIFKDTQKFKSLNCKLKTSKIGAHNCSFEFKNKIFESRNCNFKTTKPGVEN